MTDPTDPCDLTDPEVRARVTERLAAPIVGRPVIIGPMVLAGATPLAEWWARLGSPVLVVATARGAGPVPGEECTVVDVDVPATRTLTEELRTHDRLARSLPPDVAAAIKAFDPEQRGVWWGSPFVTTDSPVLGRPVVAGRPQAFIDLEDKLFAETLWAAAHVERATCAVVAVDDDAALLEATERLASPLCAVWSGDSRDGFNGGGEFVRWVRDEADAAAAAAFFKLHCDQVRVLPFLDGVPCSIHGFVLPDGTAAMRPVEISVLRAADAPLEHRLTQGGLSSFWDPPAADREAMRAVVRRVGEHLRGAHGYRGAFGIDGVLTAAGFRPTELNTRMSAGLTRLAELDRWFFTMLQTALVNGWDTGLGVADIEGLLPLLDAHRSGRAVATGVGADVPELCLALAWDGTDFAVAADQSAPESASDLLLAGPTPTGWFAKVQPCSVLSRPGDRLAVVDVALRSLLDREWGTGIGPLEIAPDVRGGGAL